MTEATDCDGTVVPADNSGEGTRLAQAVKNESPNSDDATDALKCTPPLGVEMVTSSSSKEHNSLTRDLVVTWPKANADVMDPPTSTALSTSSLDRLADTAADAMTKNPAPGKMALPFT
jgi:hypothetical protein